MSELDGIHHVPRRIPDFASIEEAEWWNTYDITDYRDELRPVEVRVSPNFTSIHRFIVEVEGAGWKALDRCMRIRDMTPATLVRL